MGIFRTPLLQEGIGVYFSGKRSLSIYQNYLIIISAILFIWWPKSQYFDYLKDGKYPQTYNVITVCILLCVAYLNSRFGAEEISKEDFNSISDWLSLTPIPIGRLIWGKIALSFIHTSFLVLISTPFIVISRTTSGVSFNSIFAALLIILFCTFTYRVLGLFFLITLGKRPLFSNLGLRGALAFLIIATIFLFPPASSILALISLDSNMAERYQETQIMGISLDFFVQTILIHVFLFILFSVASFVILSWYRRRYQNIEGVPENG